ncbi:S9 family peptidase [Streptomyces solincola]|uniref:S9 family peptidase n=1 Tax=Streptomyces solincola TaxID=2100817 RepID=A0A2S9PU81_9ACTN|nr:alpha/beta fold hydrolase [Streptomyces solincola]PRH77974.1 S9 family peptidase [Streptomyces solincola]
MAADARNRLTGGVTDDVGDDGTDRVIDRMADGVREREPDGVRDGPVDGLPQGPSGGVRGRPARGAADRAAWAAAPAAVALADAPGGREVPRPLTAHACWYPSADPSGERIAFVCDRGGVPQLWTGPAYGAGAEGPRLLDAGPDPVTEAAWSPDGRWIAYTVAPGGGELTRVLCVRPDGTGRHIVAGAEPGSSAYLGCWAPDGSAVAVTVALPPGGPDGPPAEDRPGGRDLLAAHLVDPDGVRSPVLLAAERGAATLRVCDVSRDGRLALVRRGPRGRREAVVVRTADRSAAAELRVADGDPWIGRFAPDGRTVWLRSDHGREFAALLALRLDAAGAATGLSVAAQRAECDLELLAFTGDGRSAALAWNVRGASELRLVDLAGSVPAADGGDAGRAVGLEHEVVTRIAPAGAAGAVLALAGSQRRPGVWWLPGGGAPVRTGWSSRDEDAVPPGRPPVRPVALRPVARDGLALGGWYYRAAGPDGGRPAPCVVHLHGGPEDQERPVFSPLYHELLGRGLDVFAPDVRGSSGYGRSFTDADLGAGRFAALDDVADCVAHAVLAGLADPARIAVMGHSYGGYLTMASLVWHPELFRTGVAVCGMSDFATFFAGTEPWIAESAAHKYGHPERDRDLLRSLSPMSRVDALRVPLLAVHGEHDTNVPPGESEQFVRAAREHGLPAELLVLRDEGHEFRRADNRRRFRRSAADWLERHLR